MRAPCPRCKTLPWQDASLLDTVLDFFWLYFIGVYELLRQGLQLRLHSPRFLPFREITQGCGEEAGCIVVLSGASSGIGRHIQMELNRRGVPLLLLTHPLEAGHFPENEEVLVDFNSFSATKHAAKQVRSILSRSSRSKAVVFFHCAGICNPRVTELQQSLTLGTFQTFAVNTVMPALFLKSISDLLTGVIYLGSSSQKVAPTPSHDTCPFRLATTPYSAYPLSKMLTLAYVERWSHVNRKLAIIIHPGVAATNLYRNEIGFARYALQLLLPFSALSAGESASRVLEILDRTRFFERTSRGETMELDTTHAQIYWDAATMTPAMLPRQIAGVALRELLFEHINSVIDCWPDS